MPRHPTRRIFLLGTITASTLGSLVPSRSQAIAPLVVIAAIEAFISLVQAFSKSDGGLAALLQAQQAKLDLAISQLNQIQEQVAYLAQDVSDLRQQLTDQIHEAPVRALAIELSAALLNYVEVFDGAGGDLDKIRTGYRRERLEDIEKQVIGARLKLMSTQDNFGPGSGVMAPAAMGLEVSVSILLGRDNAWLRRSIQSYQEWFANLSDMTSDVSIPSFMQGQRVVVDNQWAQIAQSRIGKQVAYQNGSGVSKNISMCDVLSEQQEGEDRRHCQDTQQIGNPNNGDMQITRCVRYATLKQYSTWTRLQRNVTFSTASDSVVLLDNIASTEVVEHHPGTSEPPPQPNCAISGHAFLTTDLQRDDALRKTDGYSQDDRELSAIQDAVGRANDAKLRLAFASGVLVAVEDAKVEAARRMAALSG